MTQQQVCSVAALPFYDKVFCFFPGPTHASEGVPYTAETNGFHDNRSISMTTDIQDDRLED